MDLLATMLKVEIEGVQFEIWNANGPETTYLYSIENSDFQTLKPNIKFINPEILRLELRGDNYDPTREKLERELKEKINEIDNLKQINDV